MEQEIEIIGIDHGWSMVKTSSQVFVTGVKEITTEPGMFDDVLELDGKYYKIGGVSVDLHFAITTFLQIIITYFLINSFHFITYCTLFTPVVALY